MSVDDYWHNGDYTLFWAYREKYRQEEEKKFRNDRNLHNFNAWLNGIYLNVVIDNLFSGKNTYPEHPIDFDEMDKEALRLSQMTEEEIYQEKLLKHEEESKQRKKELILQLQEQNE